MLRTTCAVYLHSDQSPTGHSLNCCLPTTTCSHPTVRDRRLTCTSALDGTSSVSAISELKVYSDSLLLWVESVLLCPGLDTVCKASNPGINHMTQFKQGQSQSAFPSTLVCFLPSQTCANTQVICPVFSWPSLYKRQDQQKRAIRTKLTAWWKIICDY